MTMEKLIPFIQASNLIEGLTHHPTEEEQFAYALLLSDTSSTNIVMLRRFLAIIAPGHSVRNKVGQNVRVGSHRPSPGGPHIDEQLGHWMVYQFSWDPIIAYSRFQHIHPLTDGNGRTGRALYLRQKLMQCLDTTNLLDGYILEDMHYQMLSAFDKNLWATQAIVKP